jgi:uncharacterized protein (DUF433 family)
MSGASASSEDLLEEYPELEMDDIRAVPHHAAHVMRRE